MADFSISKVISSIWGGSKKVHLSDITADVIPETPAPFIKTPTSNFSGGGQYNFLFAYSYNGEKNLGEMGPVRNYKIDYDILRMRSWQSFIESEITQTVIKRYGTWMIGKHLKLQCEPMKTIFDVEGVKINIQEFCKIAEARFQIYRKSKMSDHSGMRTLDMIATSALINSIVGGDVLVVLRYENENLTVQLIDGAHLQSPMYGSEWFPQELANGNQIINGIEVNERKQHVAYWVRSGGPSYKIERIPVRGSSSGMEMAFIVSGLEYRIDNMRTLPLIATVLETLKKLERYKEATIGSAEEVAKVSYQIIHKEYSDGSAPFQKTILKAHDIDAANTDIPVDSGGKEIANNIAASTNKQAFNMPVGSKVETLNQSNGQINFKDFYSVNIDIICASLGIPPDVAMSKYDKSFSASRAALKDWEHTLQVKRNEFALKFYQPIYNFWLEIEILKGKIQAPGYLQARMDNNQYLIEAFRNARWVGAPVPHIDPLKEVNAERMKLGKLGENLPLTTLEAATESLNGGESDSNLDQFALELESAKKLKLEVASEPPKTGSEN